MIEKNTKIEIVTAPMCVDSELAHLWIGLQFPLTSPWFYEPFGYAVDLEVALAGLAEKNSFQAEQMRAAINKYYEENSIRVNPNIVWFNTDACKAIRNQA